jgi:hypothetical protein
VARWEGVAEGRAERVEMRRAERVSEVRLERAGRSEGCVLLLCACGEKLINEVRQL